MIYMVKARYKAFEVSLRQRFDAVLIHSTLYRPQEISSQLVTAVREAQSQITSNVENSTYYK